MISNQMMSNAVVNRNGPFTLPLSPGERGKGEGAMMGIGWSLV